MTEQNTEKTRGWNRRSILKKVRTGLLAYLALCLIASLLYRHALYPAPEVDSTPNPPDATELLLTAADGVPVRALLFVGQPNNRTIVCFHGNGESVGENVPLAQALVREGFNVALVEYRGYGRSFKAGSPTEAGLYADGETVFAELKKRGVDDKNIVVWGHSLGSGVAAEMAYRGHGGTLVLLSPFTSIPDVAAKIAPWLPVHLIIRDKFDTLSKAPSIHVPTMVMHGSQDRVIPVSMGKKVAAALPNGTFVPADADHNDLFALAARLHLVAGFARIGALVPPQ